MHESTDQRRPGVRRVSATVEDERVLLHFPGGRLRSTDWSALAAIASDHGGEVRAGSCGSLEISSVRDHDRLWARGVETGLLEVAEAPPRLPVVLASPLAGRLDGRSDLGDLPDRLGAALIDRPGAHTPDQQLVLGIDDGSGDVLAHSPDLAVAVDSADGGARLHVAGRAVPYRVAVADAATVLVDVAVTFAGSAGPVRVPGSGAVHQLVVVALGSHPDTVPSPISGEPHAATTPVSVPRVGWVDTADGLVSLLAVVPDGIVSARLAAFLGAVERPTTVSADRVIGLHGLTDGMAEQVVRVLAPMGMIFDAESPWVTGES